MRSPEDLRPVLGELTDSLDLVGGRGIFELDILRATYLEVDFCQEFRGHVWVAALWFVLHHDWQFDRVRDRLVMLEDCSLSQLQVLRGRQHDGGGPFDFLPLRSFDSHLSALSSPVTDN